MERNLKTIAEAHHTWLNPVGGVTPANLLNGEKRSAYLVELIRTWGGEDPSILEVGCNAGRNLNALWQAGYKKLSGLEIYPGAIEVMKKTFDITPTIYLGPVEEQVRLLPDFDVIYSMCVLMHFHPESTWVFEELAKRAPVLIVIEDEKGTSDWKWPRNYKAIFEGLGMQQVFEENCGNIEGLGDRYFTRVFKKAEGK